MILSHDQAQVEHGFSFNSKILVENLQKESLVAQRHVTVHMHCNNIQAHKYSRCYATINEKSQSKLQSNKQKLKALNDDINENNQQTSVLKRTIITLRADADKAILSAEKKAILQDIKEQWSSG